MMKKNLVVIGGGESGLGASLLAKKNGWDVFLSDNGIIKDKSLLIKNNIDFEEQRHSLDRILMADEIVKSPGISDNIDLFQKIRSKNIPVISEIEFACRFTSAKIIAITGSNGKTTTTLLTHHILRNANLDVLIAGNIGFGLSKALLKKDYEYIVLELSSFQLDGIVDFKPFISILLNITPDHLDRYNNDFDQYVRSKLRITLNQTENDFCIYNIDDDHIRSNLKTKAQCIPFSAHSLLIEESVYYKEKQINININNRKMKIQELALQGKHNLYNSMAAAVASRVLEVKDFIIRQSLLDFKNIEHRLEYVLNVHGVDFVNDSKATNVNATWYAIESMNKPVVWIAGGVNKGNDYNDLLLLAQEKVKSIVCLGSNNRDIHITFKSSVESIVDAGSMMDAVQISYDLADEGDVVLLSPSCASFDLFNNYEDRGIQFKKAVKKL